MMFTKKSALTLVLIHILSMFSILFAQDQIVFTLTHVPEYTPDKDNIYLSGSFNNWALADSNSRFRRLPDGTYKLVMRLMNKKSFEFKVNRGNWDKVEGNDVGGYLANHEFNYSDSIFEYKLEVQSWQDLHKSFFPATIIKVVSFPENTPKDAKIYVAGTFNGWKCNDPEYELKKATDGTHFTEVNSGLKRFSFKFSRGSWKSVEARWDGGVKSNREHVAQSGKAVTIIAEIDAWEDLSQRLLIWKILFASFFVQFIIIAVFLLRIDTSKFLFGTALFLSVGYISRYIHCDYVFASEFPKLRLVSPWMMSFFVAPVALWFHRKYIEKNQIGWVYALPFLPVLVLIYLWQIPDKQFTNLVITNEISYLNLGLYVYAILINFYFINRLKKLIAELHFKVSNLHKRLFDGLHATIILVCMMLFFVVLSFALPVRIDVKQLNDWFENLSWIAIGVLMLYSQMVSLLETRVVEGEKEPVEQRVSLSDKHRDSLKDKLTQLMEAKALYANPKLTLAELARHLGTNTFYVSKLINEGFEMSFTDYVNTYRVKAFVKEMENSSKDQTFLYVALKMGFNSKSSFNRAFKKAMGKTPSDYFDREEKVVKIS